MNHRAVREFIFPSRAVGYCWIHREQASPYSNMRLFAWCGSEEVGHGGPILLEINGLVYATKAIPPEMRPEIEPRQVERSCYSRYFAAPVEAMRDQILAGWHL